MSCSRREFPGDEMRGTDRPLQFLLFLTALFASFTGVFSGARAMEPREVGQAFATPAAVADASVRPVRQAVAVAFVQSVATTPVRIRAVRAAVPALLPEFAPVDERRLQ